MNVEMVSPRLTVFTSASEASPFLTRPSNYPSIIGLKAHWGGIESAGRLSLPFLVKGDWRHFCVFAVKGSCLCVCARMFLSLLSVNSLSCQRLGFFCCSFPYPALLPLLEFSCTFCITLASICHSLWLHDHGPLAMITRSLVHSIALQMEPIYYVLRD